MQCSVIIRLFYFYFFCKWSEKSLETQLNIKLKLQIKNKVDIGWDRPISLCKIWKYDPKRILRINISIVSALHLANLHFSAISRNGYSRPLVTSARLTENLTEWQDNGNCCVRKCKCCPCWIRNKHPFWIIN